MLDPEEPTPEDTGTNPSYSRGLDLFIKLYTPETASRIVYSMEETNCSPDLPNFAISRIYGDLLSETSIISEKETGLIAMASCLSLAVATDEPEVGLDAQVKGHMYGAKNLGASGQEIRGVVRTISAIFRTIRDRNHKVVKDAAKVGRDEKEGYTKWMPKDWGHPLTKVLLQAKGWDAEKIIHGQPRYKPRARFHSNLRDWRKGTKNKSK